MFGIGLSGLLGKAYIGMPLPCKFSAVSVPYLCKIPILGPSLFSRDPLLYLSVPVTIFLWFLLFKTRWGISIRSVGENPAASDAMGVKVYRVQYLCVITGGLLSGFAGAYLSLAYIPSWIEGMVGGGMDCYRVDDICRLESHQGIYWRLSFWRHLCLAVSLTAVGHIAKYPYDAPIHNHPLCPVSRSERVAEEKDGITGFSWCGL